VSFWRRIALWTFSVGWLLPIGCGLVLVDNWLVREVYPSIHGGASHHGVNSFEPYFFGRQFVMMGFCWLALVVVYWTSRLMAEARQD